MQCSSILSHAQWKRPSDDVNHVYWKLLASTFFFSMWNSKIRVHAKKGNNGKHKKRIIFIYIFIKKKIGLKKKTRKCTTHSSKQYACIIKNCVIQTKIWRRKNNGWSLVYAEKKKKKRVWTEKENRKRQQYIYKKKKKKKKKKKRAAVSATNPQ